MVERDILKYISKVMLSVSGIALSANALVTHAATNTYLVVNGRNMLEAEVSGKITTYTPSFGNNDHRDYMLYMVSGRGDTIGAGVQWWKHPSYGLMNRLIVCIYEDGAGHAHVFKEDNSGIPNGATTGASVTQVSPNSTC